jgi:hypothetical protein
MIGKQVSTAVQPGTRKIVALRGEAPGLEVAPAFVPPNRSQPVKARS